MTSMQRRLNYGMDEQLNPASENVSNNLSASQY